MQTVAQRYEEAVPVGRLKPHPENPNVGDTEGIRSSIEELGFYGAVIAHEDTGVIIAGKHRWDAAVAEGAEHVPVLWLQVDERAAKKIMAGDNRWAERSRRDDRALADLLRSLEGDLAGTGYAQDDLDALLQKLEGPKQGRTDPDEVPEPPSSPITQTGDLWLLGEHRVLCGDARDRNAYDRVLTEEHLAGTVVTDPPYGVAIGAKNRALDTIDRAGRVLTDMDGDMGMKEVEELWRVAFPAIAAAIPPGYPYYVFGPQGGDLGLLLLLLRDAGLAPRHILTWVKNRPSFSIGRLDYDYQHEPIVYGWKPGAGHPWHADGPRTSVLTYDRPQRSPDHATVKPVALLAHLIENSTTPNGLVLDPFGGSGSTLIAAEQLGRRGRLIEIAPKYVDLTCRRYFEHTGEKPILERTGEPWAE